MSRASTPLEERVARLEAEVQELTFAVFNLEQLLTADQKVKLHKKEIEKASRFKEGASEELLSWVDKSSILPRIATTSFILVVAVALRTATESQVIDQQLGSLLGILYAFGLIVYGWFAYREKNIHAPVFTLWGTIVMCAVVVEAHRVFASVPTELAYFVLALTGLVTAIMSRMNHVALPVFVGTLGMSLGAFSINYPTPYFPYLAVILVLANSFAAYATRLLRASWLRWLLFFLTLFMVQIWDLKLTIYLGKLAPENLEFSISGFMLSISALGVVFGFTSLLGVLGKLQEKVSKFDLLMPVLNVLWLYVAGSMAMRNGLTSPLVFGWAGVMGAISYLWIAWWLANYKEGDALGTTPFALGGGLLLAFTVSQAVGHDLIGIAIVGGLSVSMVRLSEKRSNQGLRLVSYFLQLYACIALALTLRTTEGTAPSLVGALASGLLAFMAFYHYYWSRKFPPEPGDPTLDRLNKNDRGAALMLIAALINGFFTLRVGLYQALDMASLAQPNVFAGAQSVLIIVSAAVLFIISLKKHHKELRNVAVVVTVIGGCKVFLLDMMQIRGMPLMISVFSFGLVAALASFVLGRWNKGAEDLHQERAKDS
jgi:hypothetical protein